MRQYAWYSPELDVIVLQSIMNECYIAFEWSPHDMWGLYDDCGNQDPMDCYLWMPMGEL